MLLYGVYGTLACKHGPIDPFAFRLANPNSVRILKHQKTYGTAYDYCLRTVPLAQF